MEEQIMWNILGRELTPYAVCNWLAGAAALAVFLWQGRKLKGSARIWMAGLGILLGLLGARLYYVLARLDLFMDIGFSNFFRAQDGEEAVWGAVSGAAFWGAVGGVGLAALIAGKITGEKVSGLLDALAPAAALGIAVSRFGEFSIGEGIGPEVTSEALQFFPLAVQNEWGEWNYALFLLEGLTGLVIFALLLIRGRKGAGGDRARMFLILYSSTQILLEALRRDNFLRWLFVRISQVNAAVVLLALLAAGLFRWLREPGAARRSPGRLLGKALLYFAAFAAALFAVLLAWSVWVLQVPLYWDGTLWWTLICDGWPISLAALAGLTLVIVLQRPGKNGLTEKQAALCFAAFVLAAMSVIAMEFGIDKSSSLDVPIGYLMEAFACVIMGRTVWLAALSRGGQALKAGKQK